MAKRFEGKGCVAAAIPGILALFFSLVMAGQVTPPGCINDRQRILLKEDSFIVFARFMAPTGDGNFLVPGYYYPNGGFYFKMPYLFKCTPSGKVLWSKAYPTRGNYPSSWYTATRVSELRNGDLLMVGEIGVPGTDDRREMAVWRLDKEGKQIWAQSYESSLWKDPITGSTDVTGIQEDEKGNIFLAGNLRFFEAPRFAFLLKLNPNGEVVWDNNYGTANPLVFGSALLQGKLLLIGRSGTMNGLPPLQPDVLWCATIDSRSGATISIRGWQANFGQQSAAKSFGYANSTIGILDNGEISVVGAANSDYLATVGQGTDTIRHSIIANFTPDFSFLSGVMLSSTRASNYNNTLVTQHPNGRISFTRFIENNNLYDEDILYGSVENNMISEKVYHQTNRSAAALSNFLFYQPDEHLSIQSYTDSTGKSGGLELITFRQNHPSDACSGVDTSLTFIEPYFMIQSAMRPDSIVSNAFRITNHNFLNESTGTLAETTGCNISPGVHADPFISLGTDSMLCRGNSLELSPGAGFNRYQWNTGSDSPEIQVNTTGKYWVTVTDQNGCSGSDTVSIMLVNLPDGFLPRDTFLCGSLGITLAPKGSFQNYLWSDLSTSSNLSVNQPGSYWLHVTDDHNCSATDTIAVVLANCSNDMFVPGAFTPNNDGLNDVFRPKFFGDVLTLDFIIYDRWGQKVFESGLPGAGWNGRYNGIQVPPGVFVWFCRYQLPGRAPATRKGTVMLLR